MIKKSSLKSKLLSEEVRNSARREWAIHSTLKHKNIIELYEYTENEDQFDLFLEYANKPTYLTDLIIDCHTPIEDPIEFRHLATDILEGLAYIHDQGIIHGDLKLDNMLCNEEDGVITVKICDFGFSHICDVHKKNKVFIKDVSGTIGHIAPEVKHNSLIGVEVDMWWFGLMLYEMAVAYKPTQIKDYSYTAGEIPFRRVDWRRKSPELQDLISKWMAFNPEDRLSAIEALQHPWFSLEN